MLKNRGVAALSVVIVTTLCAVSRADLLGYWPLEETSGAVATNLVPAGQTVFWWAPASPG